MANDREAQLVAQACRALGDPAKFEAPPGYPDSLALCILDSVWSLGVKYRSVENVLDRWRGFAKHHDIEPETASATDLIKTIEEAGGPKAFADDVVCNHQRTSSKNGILKADAVYQCAGVLKSNGVNTTQDLRENHHLPEVKKAWRKVPGQTSSSIGWHYLLILANVDDVKADRMLTRFVDRAIGRSTSSATEVRDLVLAAQQLLVDDSGNPSVRALDHEIWSSERAR